MEDISTVIDHVFDVYYDEIISHYKTDGISLEFADWRFNSRSSNTGSLLDSISKVGGNAEAIQKNIYDIKNNFGGKLI